MSSSSCVHCWTVPLPNVFVADQRRPAAVVERAGDDLGRGRRAAVDEHHDLDRRVGRDAAGLATVSIRLPSAYSCQKIGPSARNWLAMSRAAVDEAARVAAQVDDQRLLAALDCRRDRRVELRRRARSEKPASRM